MALGLPAQGEFNDYIKFDARAGRFSRMDNKEATDITQSFTAMFDLAQIEVGWALFGTNAAPEFVVARIGQTVPLRPSDKHKRAFRMKVKLGKSCGGDVREFASAAGCVIQAIDELHDAYSAAPESAKGQLPIVTMTGSSAVKTQTPQGMTTNYRPNFVITTWQPRPADMPIDGEQATVRAPATVAPVAAKAAQPATVGADVEF